MGAMDALLQLYGASHLAPVRGTNTALAVSSAFCATEVFFQVRSLDEAILYQASRAKHAE